MRIKDRSRLIPAGCALLAALALTGCGEPKTGAGGGMMGQGSRIPEVAAVTVQPESVVITTELAGRTSPCLVAEVRPQVGGIVQKRLFEEGADVLAGDVLYQIDPATYQAAHESAKASLARSEANAVPARLRAKRYAKLLADKVISPQEVDDAIAAQGQAEAEIEACKAAVKTARINLDYTRVTAPISGRIGKSSVTVGALVTANQGAALATIQQLDPMYVDVTQSSANVLNLKRKMAKGLIKQGGANQARVRLLLEDGSAYALEGTLEFSGVTVDVGTGSVELRTVFPNPDHLMLPGMYVRALLEEGVSEGALLVPQQAVTRDAKGNPVVMVVGDGNKVEARMLKIDRAIGEKWLVSDGLKAGDRAIMEGLQNVRPGAEVKVVPFGEKTPALTGPSGSSAPAGGAAAE
jgi:membrane fusion protein (multidrug efflux system)